MEQQKNNKEELIKEILEEEDELQQYVDNLEQEVNEINKRIVIKQEYLNALNENNNE